MPLVASNRSLMVISRAAVTARIMRMLIRARSAGSVQTAESQHSPVPPPAQRSGRRAGAHGQPSESGPFPDNQALLDLAVEAGAEESEVSEGILEETMRDWVDAATQAAQEAGVQGTPTVLVDGQVVQGSPEEILQAVRDAVA